MAGRREEILRAISEASTVLDRYEIATRTSFDVLGAITDLGIPVLFRPLKGLWGATITLDDDLRGILVTNKLPLHIQRFTLAHELGHVLLGHRIELDEKVGFAGRYGPKSLLSHEIAADTFASELLGAKPYVLASARRHHWTRDLLRTTQIVYQLSLRLGISFEAACWTLAALKLLSPSEAGRLQDKTTVKDLKVEILRGGTLEDSWADVWMITANDTGTFLEGGPADVFAIHLNDYASSGYIWELLDTGPYGRVVHDAVLGASNLYGEATSRIVFIQFDAPGIHRLAFAHRRPWNKQTLAHIDIAIDSYGKEMGGFPRRVRQEALSAVAS